MPFLQQGSDATVVIPAAQSVRIGALQGAVSIATIPTGLPGGPIATVTDNQQVFGPYPAGATINVFAAKGVTEFVVGAAPVLTGQLFNPTAVSINGGIVGGQAIKPISLIEARGDSITFGSGLASQSQTYSALWNAVCAPAAAISNLGAPGSGCLARYTTMVANGVSTPTQTIKQTTLLLPGYNDMRNGASGLSNIAPSMAAFSIELLLASSSWAGLLQYYNGGVGGTFYGAPTNTFIGSGFAGISIYGAGVSWRGLNSTTIGSTVTATVNGSVVYVAYDKNAVNTGGTFQVAIDGVIVAALVSCDGTGLTVASGSDQSSGTNAGGGFPTLLRFPTTAGKHSVVVTVTSATASTNFVQIEFIAGNTDLQAGVRATVVGLCLRMNAAGYLGAPAAYGSQIIGDAVVALYQRAQREICNQFIADGFDIRIADSNSFYDPTVVANVQADNIHPTQAGQVTIANSMIAAWNRGQAVQQTAGGSSFIQTRPAPTSAAFVQNTSAFPIEVFITGGTVTSVNFSRDGINNIQVSGATPAQVRLNSGDWYAVTYTVAPTINVIPR